MRLFAVLAVMMICFAGIFHMMFIMFDYVYYHPDNGVFTLLPERMNETMSANYSNAAWNNTVMLRQAFGVGRFAVLGLAVVFFIVGIADYTTTRKGGG